MASDSYHVSDYVIVMYYRPYIYKPKNVTINEREWSAETGQNDLEIIAFHLLWNVDPRVEFCLNDCYKSTYIP